MFDKKDKREVGFVYSIVDLVQDEAIIPQFCSKTQENAKRQFAIFLNQNKFKPADFELRQIGVYYSSEDGLNICRGSEVLLSNYMREDFEASVDKE